MVGNNPADEMFDAVNSGVDVEEFKSSIKSGHNYLQRSLFDQVLKPAIIALAEVEQIDRRNRRAVESAREVCEAVGWEYE